MISRRVNSGHPLFIGYGRTGADSPMDHQKNQVVFATWFFCIYQEGNRTKFSVAKRRSIKERIRFSLRVRSPSGGRQPLCRFATFPLKGESPRWLTKIPNQLLLVGFFVVRCGTSEPRGFGRL